MAHGYKDSASVIAHRVFDDRMVDLKMTNLSLFGAGVFSNVYRGVAVGVNNNCREVAVKKTWRKNHNSQPTSTYNGFIPELGILKLLNRLQHKNIVQLLYDFANGYADKTCYSLVFEFLPSTLYTYMKQRKRRIGLVETKMFTWQLFRGQAHLKKSNIVHSDIKPQNILVDPESGLLKISDFGSSVVVEKGEKNPSYKVTRYYRPPELLLEAQTYGCEVDVWSCGCVFGELLGGRALLCGINTRHQLDLIIDTLGLPTQDQAAAMYCPVRTFNFINNTMYVQHHSYPRLQNIMPSNVPVEAVRLLERILVYTPSNRLRGLDLLNDPFFMELFSAQTKRPDGKTIGCLGPQDIVDVRQGDACITAESLSME